MKIPIIIVALAFMQAPLRGAEDERPVVNASQIAEEKNPNASLPTFHIVGDSTVKSGGTEGMFGWGERIKPFFDTKKINVINHAIGGRSARTFFTEGRWQKVSDVIKAGDIVIIQFGHNDQGRIDDPANKGRASGAGIGDETVEVTKPDDVKELVHTFGWYLTRFTTDAKAKGATVILCSPIPHKENWESGRDFEALAEWDRQVAVANSALFFDLTVIISDTYKKLGKEKVQTLYADKGTHTTSEGAEINASCVIVGLKSLSGNPLGKFFPQSNAERRTYTSAR